MADFWLVACRFLCFHVYVLHDYGKLSDMATITVIYFKVDANQPGEPDARNADLQLGCERFEGIGEVLLPWCKQHKVFFVKKFESSPVYRWCAEAVDSAVLADGSAVFHVFLSDVTSAGAEEYLFQTLKKSHSKPNRFMKPGTLVEVDFGFALAVGRHDGEVRTNKRYSDTLQQGEMPKRRLAVVLKSERDVVQVLPVTSQSRAGDRTAVQLSPDTLRSLTFYGRSGKDSWVLASVIETVSTRRILPPMSSYVAKDGRTRHARDPKYSCKVSNTELRLIRVALEHVVGIDDYDKVKQEAREVVSLKRQITALDEALEAERGQLVVLQSELARLREIERIAKEWASSMGTSLP